MKMKGDGRFATVHGMHRTPTHNSWSGMLGRCNTKSNASYRKYGVKGIKVCLRWLSFENFYADMGDKPKGKTLDRIDSRVGYEPSNCRWATYTEQNRNRKCTKLNEEIVKVIRYYFEVKDYSVIRIAKALNMNRGTVGSVTNYSNWKEVNYGTQR